MTFSRWTLYLTLLAWLAACNGPLPAAGISEVANVPTATPTSTQTPTAWPTATPSPSHTPTVALTPTPSPTSTDRPTASPTPTPSDTPTLTPVPPTPTGTPTPAIDFRIASWRLWPLALNSGCAKGMHVIFIQVVDVNGAPLDGVVVGDTWSNVEVVTGNKGPGRTEIDLWSNTMEIIVKRDAETGQPYTSEISFPFSSFMTTIPDEQLIQAGYCSNELECQWKRENESYYCGGHYSWEVIFQRAY